MNKNEINFLKREGIYFFLNNEYKKKYKKKEK